MPLPKGMDGVTSTGDGRYSQLGYSSHSNYYEYEDIQQKCFTYSNAQIQNKPAYKNHHKLL